MYIFNFLSIKFNLKYPTLAIKYNLKSDQINNKSDPFLIMIHELLAFYITPGILENS